MGTARPSGTCGAEDVWALLAYRDLLREPPAGPLLLVHLQVVFLGPGRGTIGLDESAVNSTFLTPLPLRHAPLHGSVKAELVEMQRVGVDADGYEADLDEEAEVALNLVAVGGGA